MEIKKTDKADLEMRRGEMFLVALVLILSGVYMALGWDTSVSDADYDKMLDDVVEDIDFSKLKRNNDMVAAISSTDTPAEVTKAKPVENVTQQQPVEATTTKLLVGKGKSEIPEAKVEEVKPQVLESPDNDQPEGFHVVEQIPEFPGGATAFMKWLTANIRFPQHAQSRKLNGKVVVSFIVAEDGSVTRLKVEKATSTVFSNEVIRVMNTMPKWKPGIQNGKPTAAMVTVPINFEN